MGLRAFLILTRIDKAQIFGEVLLVVGRMMKAICAGELGMEDNQILGGCLGS